MTVTFARIVVRLVSPKKMWLSSLEELLVRAFRVMSVADERQQYKLHSRMR